MKNIILILTIVLIGATGVQIFAIDPDNPIATEILDGPIFIDAGHSQEYPTTRDSILFSCEVTDDGEVVRVSLNYRLNLMAWMHVGMASTGNDSYATTLPPLAIPGTVLNYTFEAEDDESLITTWPDSGYITIVIDGLIAVDEQSQLPVTTALLQNYPNPFNSSTNINFTLAQLSQVKLAIYDILGQEITILADGILPPGNHNYQFDSSDLPSGIYFYRLTADDYTYSRRMIMLK